MDTGYVSNFSDRTFGEFFAEVADIDIHMPPYTGGGTSKANKLRAFWNQENDLIVAKVIDALIQHVAKSPGRQPDPDSINSCNAIVTRLRAGGAGLGALKSTSIVVDSTYVSTQIQRMEDAIHTDPSLAIGTAKELIETICRTILSDRGKPQDSKVEISALTKAALSELQLVPESVSHSAKGAETTRRVLANLGSLTQGIAELRNLYGTGHGKEADASPIGTAHAALAVGVAAAFARFVWETHTNMSAH